MWCFWCSLNLLGHRQLSWVGMFSSILDFIVYFGKFSIKECSLLFHDPVFAAIFSVFFILAISYFFKEQKKLPYLAFALVVAFMLGIFFQLVTNQERPCVSAPSKIPCPEGFSLPSLHSLLVFTIMIAALGNRSFPVYLLYAIFVAYSRVYLGVHTIGEVFAGLALAFFACVLTEMFWKRLKWKIPRAVHIRHDFLGLLP